MAPGLGNAIVAAEQHAASQLSAEESAYRAAIAKRAAKIIDKLQLGDDAKQDRVARIVADQYRTLRDIHDERDSKLAELDNNPSQGDLQAMRQQLESTARWDVVVAHRAFLGHLAAELSSEQVDEIKDGMTYGVVPITYNAYLDLLPDLTAEERRMIRSCLIEAREYAMDAGSSEDKHRWFGKYKGRINNYLSAHGYDLKQAEQDQARRRQQEAAP